MLYSCSEIICHNKILAKISTTSTPATSVSVYLKFVGILVNI